MFAGDVSGSDMRAHDSADRTESPIPGRSRRPRERRQARPRADVDPEAAVQHGVVVSRQATYGFVRSGRDRLFFHISDVDPACAGELGLDWEVTFRQGHDPVSGRPVAVEVAGRPPQPRAAPRELGARAPQRGRPAKAGEACPPGFFRGVVHQVSRGPPTAKLDDGIILFADPEEGAPAEGLHHQAIYGTYSLQGELVDVRVGEGVKEGGRCATGCAPEGLQSTQDAFARCETRTDLSCPANDLSICSDQSPS